MPKPRLVKKKITRGSQDVLTRLKQHLKLSHSEPEKQEYLKRIKAIRAQLRMPKKPEANAFRNSLRKARSQLGKEKKAA